MHLMLYCTGMLRLNGVLPVLICVCGGGGRGRLRWSLLEPKLTLNYLADDDLELLTLPPPLSKCWNDQCMQAC